MQTGTATHSHWLCLTSCNCSGPRTWLQVSDQGWGSLWRPGTSRTIPSSLVSLSYSAMIAQVWGPSSWVSFQFRCRKANLNGLGGGRCGQDSSTGEFAHTLCSQAKKSGVPSSDCSDICKGNGLSNPRADSRTESWRRGGSGCVRAVLGL